MFGGMFSSVFQQVLVFGDSSIPSFKDPVTILALSSMFLGGTTCLTLLVQRGLVCRMRVLSRQGSP